MNTVTKRDLVVQISDQTGLTQHQVFDVIQLFIDNATTHLAQNASVVLRNFGTFEVLTRKSKIGRNPRQPEKPVRVPARAVVKFTPGKDLKEKVRQLLPAPETGILVPAPKPAAAPISPPAPKVKQAKSAVARKSTSTGQASGTKAKPSI
ncbi:MAG: prokaryotic integration host factor signature [Verrucomicrobiales bacterium]|nr:prokaryotic integration host factor signature [Verrucomicrobiales bacterium]